MRLQILILGMNGFIGHRLAETIVMKTDWEVTGMDLSSHRLTNCLHYPQVHFQIGDITQEKEWIEEQVSRCDVVLPLAAIAHPLKYIQDPLNVFELDFEANLEIVKLVHRYEKRVIFPSTSEVYGLCAESEFDEETSQLITGPINKERWIYSSSKQLLDRVIYAYGKHRGLRFTLFRPFNWIGPQQDEIFTEKAEHARVVSRFISNIVHQQDIVLVNGGQQRRCFTYIDDGIEALLRIIENKEKCADEKIFNIGNPNNDITIKELAQKIRSLALTYPKYHDLAEETEIISIDEVDFYGKNYQDTQHRVPSIKNATKYLNWEPRVDIQVALKNTLDFYLR